MKTMTMKFGNGTREVSVPEENLLGVIESDFEVPERSEEEVVLDALANPIGTKRLGQMVKPGQTVAIVVSDVTRLWQRMYFYLPYIVDELNKAGIKDEDIRFICALGYHRPLTDEEHRKLLGDKLADRFEMLDHVCKDMDNLVELGQTKAGTPVFINKVAMDADHLVITGCTTYHPFVGSRSSPASPGSRRSSTTTSCA
jgi:nickel-dependent lactate racemase